MVSGWSFGRRAWAIPYSLPSASPRPRSCCWTGGAWRHRADRRRAWRVLRGHLRVLARSRWVVGHRLYGISGAELGVSDRAARLLPSATLDYSARIKPPRFRSIGIPDTPRRCPRNHSFGTQWPGGETGRLPDPACHAPGCARTLIRARGAGDEVRLGLAGANLPTVIFPYYNIYMSEHETINGVPVSEEQIEAWAAEAERGYDVQALKKRGRGRPGRGALPSQVVPVRLTVEELATIDARAKKEHKTRSEIMREALAAYAA